ncbi:centrosomal protein kizuna isoform 2-T2 [Mantella aurantiaca]
MMSSAGPVREDAGLEERIGNLQRSLRDCEIKRLELEKKLFQYNSSDAHISHLKYVKLKNSLKEVCKKERKAHLRNQSFLQEFEAIENRLHGLISSSKLSHDTKMLQGWRQAEINTSSDMSRRIYHPATIFMGRQMSANSSIEHCLTQRKSPQPTKSFSISDPHSVRQAAINSNLTDSCVVPANSDTRCLNKPDKIDVETSSWQIMPVTSIASSEGAATHRTEIDKTHNGREHLAENKQSVQLSTQTQERLSPEYRTQDLQRESPSNKVEDLLVYERLVHNEERFTHTSPSGFPSDVGDHINKQASNKHNAVENLSGNQQLSKQEDNEFFNSSSDLTVSITDSDEMSADDLLEAIDMNQESPTDVQKSKDIEVKWIANKRLTDQQVEEAKEQNSHEESSSVSAMGRNNLSDNGFIHLLQSIEEMILQIGSKDMQLYQITSLTPTKKDHLVNLCNHMKPLKKEDLEACCALVFQCLQTEGGRSSFLEKTDHTFKKDEKNERTISPLLRNHLLGHVSFLKEHGILKGGVPAGFASALIPNDEMKTQQDHLQIARNEKGLTSVSSTESQSCSLPKKDQMGKGPVKPNQSKSHNINHYENSNVLPENSKETDYEDLSDISNIEIPGLMPANINLTRKPTSKQISETTISSSESSPEHRRENMTMVPEPVTQTASNKGAAKMKSKAFWGESEDSSSDIEAMLRPQTQNVDADDFDEDFD